MKIRHAIRVALILSIMGLSAGCLRPAQDQAAKQIPLAVLFRSTQCGAASPEFTAIWYHHPEQLGPLPGNALTPRSIDSKAWDPQTEGALMLHMGARRTGGFQFELDRPTAILHQGVATITIRLHQPQAGMFTSQAITSPCLLVKMPKSNVVQVEIRDPDNQLLSRIQVPASQ